jgi:hypothetical protein
MTFAASRAVLRRSHLALRQTTFRNASTTSEATQAASKTASKAKRRHQARLQEHQKVYRELHRRQDQVLAELRKG